MVRYVLTLGFASKREGRMWFVSFAASIKGKFEMMTFARASQLFSQSGEKPDLFWKPECEHKWDRLDVGVPINECDVILCQEYGINYFAWRDQI